MLQKKKRNRNEFEQAKNEWENIEYQQQLPYCNYFPCSIQQQQQIDNCIEDSDWKKRRLDSNIVQSSFPQYNCSVDAETWKKQAHEQHINYLRQSTANTHGMNLPAITTMDVYSHQNNRRSSPNDQALSNQISNQLQLDEYTGTYSQQHYQSHLVQHSQSTQDIRPEGFITVTVKLLNGAKMDVMISRNAKISELKKIIERRSSLPVDKQRIIFKGRQVPDTYSIEECGITDRSVLALVLSLHGG